MNQNIHKLKILAITTLALTSLAYCGKKDEHAHGNGHWGYQGEAGPEHWGDLSADFEACKSGSNQSPINITGDIKDGEGDLTFSYNPSNIKVVNNGHTIKVSYEGDSTITTGGKTYKLIQFHFHTPSEHKINGKAADMVAHLVHQSDDGSLAVVGVLMNAGAENEIVSSIWSNIPPEEGVEKDAGVQINIADVLPDNKGYYNYTGSLTTPPCSEGVNWFVLGTPVEASQDQIDAFKKIFPKSVRPVQPANDRIIEKVM